MLRQQYGMFINSCISQQRKQGIANRFQVMQNNTVLNGKLLRNTTKIVTNYFLTQCQSE